MKIEIEKVVEVVKDNDVKFKKLKDKRMYAAKGYIEVCKLFSYFMGDLYKLFGERCSKNIEVSKRR